MKRLLLLVPFVLFALVSCSHGPPDKKAANQAFTESDLVIIASNDFHAAIEQAEPFVAKVREIQDRHKNKHITVVAGDIFQGSIEGNHSKGRAVIDVLNRMNVTAMAMGNHDIDYGPSRAGSIIPKKGEHPRGAMNERVRESRFPWLATNVIYKRGLAPGRHPFGQSATGKLAGKSPHFINARGDKTLFPSHLITVVNGYRVCMVGAVTEHTPHITLPAFVRDLEFQSLVETVKAEAEYLRQNRHCDLVMLVAHAGLVCTRPDTKEPGSCQQEGDLAEMLRLLRALPQGTLDVAVAGHTHSRAQEVINGTPVIETLAYGLEVGVLHLQMSRDAASGRGRVEKFTFQHLNAGRTAPTGAAADITQAMTKYRDQAKRIKDRVVGKITAPFKAERYSETALANAIADSLRAMARRHGRIADVGMQNSGGIRAPLEGPVIRYEDVFRTLPFENHLSVVRLTGAQLLRMIEIGVSGGHGISGFSGIEVRAYKIPAGEPGPWDRDLNGDGKKEQWERNLVASVKVADKPLIADKTYVLATIDYLISGGNHSEAIFKDVPNDRIEVFINLPVRDGFADFIGSFKKGMNPELFLTPGQERIKWLEARPQQSKTQQ